jgi:hypothetical protein
VKTLPAAGDAQELVGLIGMQTSPVIHPPRPQPISMKGTGVL